MSVFLLLITIAIPSAWGVFDGRDGTTTGIRRGDQFPITASLLQCDGDKGGPFTVGLDVTNPGDVFTPLRSRYRYPAALADVNDISYFSVASLLVNKLAINPKYQNAFRPANFSESVIATFPQRYETGADLEGLQQICGANVIANLSESDRNADQPRFDDITKMLRSEWLVIWGNLSADDQTRIARSISLDSNRYRIAWLTEQTENYFVDMIEVLSCRVAFRWADAGPTYIPRYYLGGYCLNRNCSIPDRDEFRCHADLSFEHMDSTFFEAARWDCCWTPSRQYQCGFRKVRFPIVCDCDCRCRDKAGI